MMRKLCWMAILLVACCLGVTAATDSGPYRGPMNAGIYAETGLLKAWPPAGPPLLWSAKLGEGYGGVTVVGDTVYASGGISGTLFGFTLDGRQQFAYPYGGTSWKRFGGTKSAPLIHGDTAIVTKPNADIIALDLKTGQEKWTLNAWKSFGSTEGAMGWGYPSTPAIYEDKLILNPCSRSDTVPPVVAVDIASGKTVWQGDAGTGKKYSAADLSASVFTHNGRAMSANPTWRYLLMLDPKTGKQLWEIPDADPAKGGERVLTPTYGNGYLLYDQDARATLIKLNEDGSGYTPLWGRQLGQSFCHGVIIGKRVYVGGDFTAPTLNGEEALTTPETRNTQLLKPRLPKGATPLPSAPNGLLCIDAETGEVVDFIRMNGGLGHVVAADGMLYAVNMPRSPEAERKKTVEEAKLGLDVYLIKPVDDGMEVMGQFHQPMSIEDSQQVKELEYQANINPVVAAGRLFIRYGPLWVYDLRPGKQAVAAPQPTMPASGTWDLWLRGFFEGGHDLLVTLQLADGTPVTAAAVAPQWNRAVHTVAVQECSEADGALTATLAVTLNPDKDAPAGTKPITCTVQVRATCAQGGRLIGTYSGGQADGTRLGGRITPAQSGR